MEIKMPLSREVDLGPSHIVLDGDLAPPKKWGTAPKFSAHVCYGQTTGWIKMSLATDFGGKASVQVTLC